MTGEPQTKQLKDLMPEIMKQVGPQQYEALKTLVGDYAKQSGAAGVAADDEDDVPPHWSLVPSKTPLAKNEH